MAFITILVWVWADLEQTTTELLTVTVKIEPPLQSDIRVITPKPEGIRIGFTCRGPQGRITEFRRQLQENDTCIVPADPSWPSRRQLTTTQILNKWDRLRQANLTAESPDRETIDVEIDRWLEAEATVQLKTSDDDALEAPVPEPKVKIRVPDSEYDRLKDNLIVDTEVVDLGSLEPGKDITLIVLLAPRIGQVPIQFVESDQVEVTFRIGERTASDQITVPVQLLASPDLWERITAEGYVLSRDPNRRQEWLLKVTLQGPRTEVERVTPELVQAFASITEADLTPTPTYPPRQVTIALPPDLRGLEIIEPTEPVVHYRFDKRANGPQ